MADSQQENESESVFVVLFCFVFALNAETTLRTNAVSAAKAAPDISKDSKSLGEVPS